MGRIIYDLCSAAAAKTLPESPMSTRRKILFSLVTVVAVVVLLEVGLRLTLPVLRTATVPGQMIAIHLDKGAQKYDPDLFWYWPRLPIDGLQLNEHGFRRSTPMTVEKPAGVVRAVTFGDSQTWGAFHSQEQSYSGVAERQLGKGWEVLNAAVPGYRSLNVYRLLRLRVARFKPDIIVVDCMPFDSQRDDGVLSRPPLGAGLGKRALWHSRIYYALRHLVQRARRGAPHAAPSGTFKHLKEGAGNHDLLKAWGDRNGVKVVFMEYPVMTEDKKLLCTLLPGHLPRGALFFRACQALRKSGYAVTDLFHDHNHFTILGNEVVGYALAEMLRTLKP